MTITYSIDGKPVPADEIRKTALTSETIRLVCANVKKRVEKSPKS